MTLADLYAHQSYAVGFAKAQLDIAASILVNAPHPAAAADAAREFVLAAQAALNGHHNTKQALPEEVAA